MTCWKAIYKDGTSLEQYNDDGTENKYSSIDRNNLSQFILIQNHIPKVVIHLREGQKLIYRRRVAMPITGINAFKSQAVYLAGWQENRNGVNFQCITFLFEDGHIEVVDRFYEKHPWFYSVRFIPEERTDELLEKKT